MSRLAKKLALVVALMVLSVLCAASLVQAESPQSAVKLKVGVVLALSGPVAAVGDSIKKSILMASRDHDKSGKV